MENSYKEPANIKPIGETLDILPLNLGLLPKYSLSHSDSTLYRNVHKKLRQETEI
jgi:hypothetical protein